MEFLELAKKRYSVRKYQQTDVSDKEIDSIIEAGIIAPTAANTQPHRIIIMKEKAQLEKLSQAANFFNAPLAFLVCGDHNSTFKRSFDGKIYVDTDTAIVTTHMMLQATALELGSLWVAYFDPKKVKELFNLAENIEPVAILAVGKADGPVMAADRHSKSRKSREEIIISV